MPGTPRTRPGARRACATGAQRRATRRIRRPPRRASLAGPAPRPARRSPSCGDPGGRPAGPGRPRPHRRAPRWPPQLDVAQAEAGRPGRRPGLAGSPDQPHRAAAAVLQDALGEDNRLVGLVQRCPPRSPRRVAVGLVPTRSLQRRIHETEQRLSAVLRAALPAAQNQAAADGRDRRSGGGPAPQAAARRHGPNGGHVEATHRTAGHAEAAATRRPRRRGQQGVHPRPSLGQAATAAVLARGIWPTGGTRTVRSRSTCRRGGYGGACQAARRHPPGPAPRRAARLPVRAGVPRGHPGLALDQYIATLRALAPLDDSTEAEAQMRTTLVREAEVAAPALAGSNCS